MAINIDAIDLTDDIMSKKAKVISCFGNIRKNNDIARLCSCSNAYVSRMWTEYIEFLNGEQ